MDSHPENIYLYVLLIIIITMGIHIILMSSKRKNKKHKKISPENYTEKRKLFHALLFPCFFLFIIWFVKFVEISLKEDFSSFGIFPGKIRGLAGIITAPLVHADFKHLFDNSIPVFLLSLAIFYFYREISYKIFIISYLVTGLLVWFIGRDAYHIGASGLIYAFASFLFFSGIARQNMNLLAISLLVIFLYGSLIWGLLPYDYRISWESHLMGGIAGFVLALIYHNQGPERKKYSWEYEEEAETNEHAEDTIDQ